MENTIAVVWDPLFIEHAELSPSSRPTHTPHPECPERLHAAREAVASAFQGEGAGAAGGAPPPRLFDLPPRDASDDELCRVHEPRYVEELSRIAGRRGYLAADTYYAPGSHAAGGPAA